MLSGPYDESAFCRIQELYERAAAFTHSQVGWDTGSRQHINHNTNEPTQISKQEQVHFNTSGVSADGFLKLIRSHFDSHVVQDETILRAFNDVSEDYAVVKEDMFHIIIDHLCEDYDDLFQRPIPPYSPLSRQLSGESSPFRIPRSSSLSSFDSPLRAAESMRKDFQQRKDNSSIRIARSSSAGSSPIRIVRSSSFDSPLRAAESMRKDKHSRTWHGLSKHHLDEADQKADIVAKPASMRSVDAEDRSPIDVNVLAAWQMFYCGGSAPGVHAQKVLSGHRQAAHESAEGCYVV